MHLNILHFKIGLAFLAAIGVFSILPIKKVEAETLPPSFIISSPEKKFEVTSEMLIDWKTPNQTSGHSVAYKFGPSVDFKEYLKQNLTTNSNTKSRIYFENYNISSIYSYIKAIQSETESDPRDAVLNINSEGRVTEFVPELPGKTVDIKSSIDAIIQALDTSNTESQLSVIITEPRVKLSQTNNLGITELVASGVSDFGGSPSNRIHNIKIGVQKQSGILLAPGEEFSFNKFLGPVDGEHGFLPELVIKKTGTVPEFGGGLCQVSSTVFRAAMNAGLPITERRNHSYAVQYYAPQGSDATIYPGVVDLKFTNNTSGYILIWPTFPEKSKLQFDFYGTKDSREVALDGPYSYDKKSNGALKAVWYRTTTLPDGSVSKDEFKSVYQPPALFHKEETFPTTEQNSQGGNTQPSTTDPNAPVTTPPATNSTT